MGKWKKIRTQILRIIVTVTSHHTGAYAAQAAYFFVLSLIPIFLLLLTMVQFTPVTMNDVMEAVLQVFPESVAPLIRSIVIQVYTQSGTVIPVTIIVALWSAGKGVLSQLHLCKNRDPELFLPQDQGFVLYGSLSSGNYALSDSVSVWKQHQRNAV